MLVLEDLHWSDPSTIDLLDALARRREPARLLVVGTYRRGEAVAQQHPVYRLVRELRARGLCAEIAVGPLSQSRRRGLRGSTARHAMRRRRWPPCSASARAATRCS